ncbi:MAG: hypothetical protein ACI8P3_003977, partial [Saprospiraceae bacterium]
MVGILEVRVFSLARKGQGSIFFISEIKVGSYRE